MVTHPAITPSDLIRFISLIKNYFLLYRSLKYETFLIGFLKFLRSIKKWSMHDSQSEVSYNIVIRSIAVKQYLYHTQLF